MMDNRTDKNKSVQMQSQTESAVDHLRTRIIDLTIAPGARLDETLLIQEFGLGRTPAREALNRLSAEGFVKIVPNRGGAYVRNLDLPEVGEIVSAYELSENILGQLCRFDHPDLVADLEAIQLAYTGHVRARSYIDITAVNERFHLRMYETIGNHFIYSFATSVHRHARRLIGLIHKLESTDVRTHDEQFDLNIRQHIDIIAAIRQKNREMFRDLIGDHAQYTHLRLGGVIKSMPFQLPHSLFDNGFGAIEDAS
jgi:DNA-binding GntR family transcriptional regulator